MNLWVSNPFVYTTALSVLLLLLLSAASSYTISNANQNDLTNSLARRLLSWCIHSIVLCETLDRVAFSGRCAFCNWITRHKSQFFLNCTFINPCDLEFMNYVKYASQHSALRNWWIPVLILNHYVLICVDKLFKKKIINIIINCRLVSFAEFFLWNIIGHLDT